MRLRPGSSPWLLRHELRLAWRGLGQGRRPWLVFLLGGVLWAGAHVAAWALLAARGAAAGPVGLVEGLFVWLLISLMLSQATLLSVSALFERGDLDLLFASPLPARRVLVVRGLGVALASSTLAFLALAPFAHVGLFTGRAHLLAIYPGLAGLGLASAAVGLGGTLALVRWIGARRARLCAQLFGAFVGAAIFLASQFQNLLGGDQRAWLVAWLLRQTAPGGLLAGDSALWLPARALDGELPALALVVAVGIGGFALVMQVAHRRFLAGTQESVTGTPRPAARAGSLRFRGGLFRNVLVKEWRLLLRDPNLIAQTLLPVLYLIPMVFMLGRRIDGLELLAPAVVFAAGTLASSLVWLTVAAEDAPELIGLAPVPLERLRWMKVCAALLPVWLLTLPPAAWMLPTRPALAAAFVVALAGATLSVGVAQVWFPRQADRRDMKRRGKRHPLLGLVDVVATIGWAALAWGLGAAQPLAAAAGLVAGVAGPAGVWVLGRERRGRGALVESDA